MKITHKDSYIILTPEKEDTEEFVKYLTKNYSDFKKDNIVIDFIKFDTLSQQELDLFLEVSNMHRSQKRSFVIVNDSINLEGIPEELILAPTLLEAGDIIGMEELERELGF
jgi:predicted metal-dependent TIM-barrel fold hydrolase